MISVLCLCAAAEGLGGGVEDSFRVLWLECVFHVVAFVYLMGLD